MDTRHFLYAFAILVAANVVSEIILRKMKGTTSPVLAFSRPSCGCAS